MLLIFLTKQEMYVTLKYNFYDAIGNPTTYRGNALTWTNVRRLASYGSHTFSYGADGIRYRKDSTTYTLNGSTILKETNGTRTITYFYGASGVAGFQYNGTNYYYQKNLQGDIIAIYDANGTCVATYTYDAWGKVLSVSNKTTANIGTLNPFRYRSYYYDTETGLYYLQTRYYDPETGRFINSDSLSYLGRGVALSNYNLFAYCGSNPVRYIDPTGRILLEFIAIIGALVLVLAIPSDNNQVPKYQQDAKRKYNIETISFHKDVEGDYALNLEEGKLNIFFNSKSGLIHIENSYNISNKYEKIEIISNIMASEYYDPHIYSNSVETMLIEWSAHNFAYKTASSFPIVNEFYKWRGYENPTQSAQGVDFRPQLEPSARRNYNIVTLGGLLSW